MADIKTAIKNKSVKGLVEAAQEEAAAAAKSKVIINILDMIDKMIKCGDFNQTHFRQDLKLMKDQQDKNLKTNAGGALRALAALEIEETLSGANIKMPSLVREYIEKENNIITAIGDDGVLTIVIENKNGLSGETLTKHIAKMKIDPATAFLFVENQQVKTIINPWCKGSVNLTEQGRIFTQSPGLAARMKKEAGVI